MRALAAWRRDGLAAYRWAHPGLGGWARWQERFHRDPARLRAIVAGNQTGKSRAGAAEAWWCATGTHPSREVNIQEGLGWICVATWGRPYQQVVRNLMATCPHDLVDWGKTTYIGAQGIGGGAEASGADDRFVNHQIVMKNGFVIRFVPTGGGSTNVAAGTVDWLWIDEPPAAAKWGELLKRTSRWGSPIWLTLTPWDSTQDLTWLRTELEGDPARDLPPAAPWSLHRARFMPADVPWKRAEDVIAERALVPAIESPIRNDGEWEGATRARVFTGYQEQHQRLPPPTDGGPWSIHVGSDWGELAGHTTSVVSAIRVSGARLPEVHVLSEVVSEQMGSTEAHAERVAAELLTLGLRIRDVRRWVGDTNTLGIASPGARVNAAFERALVAIARQQARPGERPPEIRVEAADKRAGAPKAGWFLLAEALGRDLVHIDSGRCPQLHRALTRWQGADDEHRHILDGLRYGVYDHLVDHLQPVLERIGPLRLY